MLESRGRSESPIGSNRLPVGGPSICTVLANNGTRVPGDADNNGVSILDHLVARGNHPGINGPEKQMAGDTSSERDGSLTDAIDIVPLQFRESSLAGDNKKWRN